MSRKHTMRPRNQATQTHNQAYSRPIVVSICSSDSSTSSSDASCNSGGMQKFTMMRIVTCRELGILRYVRG